MFYTIMCAMSAKNPGIIVDLCKNGNKFEVMVWNRGEHRTIRKHTEERFDTAKQVFDAFCDAYQMTSVKEVEQTWTAADFD